MGKAKSNEKEKSKSKSKSARGLVVTVGDDGAIGVEPHGISPMETPTLLRLAATAIERKMGIRD